MSDYLADVVLPPEPEPVPVPESVLQHSKESVLQHSKEDDENFALRDDPPPPLSSSSEESEDDILPPEPVKKTKLKKEDIFKIKPSEKQQPLEIKEIVKPVPIKKPKRPLTEKQLEGLAKGRLKRQENARIKNEEKDKIKSEKKKIRDQKEDAKDQRREERESRPQPAKPETFTKKDLEDATFAAVERYDNRRKARKVVKKKEQAVKKHEDNIFKDINSQLGIQQEDPWAAAFNF